MEAMYFENAVFRRGMNVTVRKGRKWKNKIGDKVQLTKVGGEVWGIGKITQTEYKSFKDVTPLDINMEHDPACREKEELYSVMKKVYPCFKMENMVTIVYFMVVEK